eukprot:c9393_g1_i2.p1 GENE.c9393_g1_i2~~c9393_g1_i2.p1  ORF type:complete len:146 (-),score=20.06 c9393_g1_i2:110-547(-)
MLEKFETLAKQLRIAQACLPGRWSLSLDFVSANRITDEEMAVHPVFKSYQRGSPSTVLFLKHLPKEVTTSDVSVVFGGLFDSDETVERQLEVRLMTQGKLKGHAFVTFPSIELATQGLELSNGFRWFDKVLVVAFGRSNKKKETD